MKKVFLATLVLLLSVSLCNAALVVTPEDVYISFPESATPDWERVIIESITYSTDSVGEYNPNPRVRLGLQTWECKMQEDGSDNRKVVIIVKVQSLKDNTRTMLLKVRARRQIAGKEDVVGPWSEPGKVFIIGKPSIPVFIK